MSFRNKIFLSITVTVVIAVWIVAGTVSAMVTNSFERRDAQRTSTLVSQFRQEFERRGAEVARRIETIANSDVVQKIAVDLSTAQPDTAQYYSVAQTQAKEQSLDFLELLSPDGEIISSATGSDVSKGIRTKRRLPFAVAVGSMIKPASRAFSATRSASKRANESFGA